MRHFFVRCGEAKDADGAVNVLRRSIRELCVPDHHDDPATLELWLQNKTPERFLAWVAADDRYVIVAESDLGICGIGLLQRTGEISLCYVLPGMQHRGIGSAILTCLEAQAKHWGLARLRLVSTTTARSFYERNGYVAAGESQPGFGISRCYPYEKLLT